MYKITVFKENETLKIMMYSEFEFLMELIHEEGKLELMVDKHENYLIETGDTAGFGIQEYDESFLLTKFFHEERNDEMASINSYINVSFDKEKDLDLLFSHFNIDRKYKPLLEKPVDLEFVRHFIIWINEESMVKKKMFDLALELNLTLEELFVYTYNDLNSEYSIEFAFLFGDLLIDDKEFAKELINNRNFKTKLERLKFFSLLKSVKTMPKENYTKNFIEFIDYLLDERYSIFVYEDVIPSFTKLNKEELNKFIDAINTTRKEYYFNALDSDYRLRFLDKLFTQIKDKQKVDYIDLIKHLNKFMDNGDIELATFMM